MTYMYDGDVVKQLERNVIRKKRFSTVKLARVSDMNSTFNPSALMPGPNKSRLANEGVNLSTDSHVSCIYVTQQTLLRKPNLITQPTCIYGRLISRA